MKSLTDSELIKKYKLENSEKAFKILYERYRQKLFAYVLKMVKNTTTAEEIIQKTYVKVITNMDKYEEEGLFGAWIYTIAYNTTIDYIRKNKKFIDTSSDYDNYDYFENIPFEHTPEDQMIGSETVDILEKCIDNLKDDQKEVIRRRIDGELFKDIAVDMDSNINTTLGRMRYARHNIEKMLGDQYGGT